jgi:hypothetical protein
MAAQSLIRMIECAMMVSASIARESVHSRNFSQPASVWNLYVAIAIH